MNFPMGRHFSERSTRFWEILKKWPSRPSFSSGWRGFVDASTPVESTSTKLSLYVDRFAWYTASLEMLVAGWDTRYKGRSDICGFQPQQPTHSFCDADFAHSEFWSSRDLRQTLPWIGEAGWRCGLCLELSADRKGSEAELRDRG
jgi:hypothetical protein